MDELLRTIQASLCNDSGGKLIHMSLFYGMCNHLSNRKAG